MSLTTVINSTPQAQDKSFFCFWFLNYNHYSLRSTSHTCHTNANNWPELTHNLKLNDFYATNVAQKVMHPMYFLANYNKECNNSLMEKTLKCKTLFFIIVTTIIHVFSPAINKGLNAALIQSAPVEITHSITAAIDGFVARKMLSMQFIFHWPEQMGVRWCQIWTAWWVW